MTEQVFMQVPAAVLSWEADDTSPCRDSRGALWGYQVVPDA